MSRTMMLIKIGYAILCIFLSNVNAYYPIYYMDELCRDGLTNLTLKDPNYFYDSTAVIKSSRSLDYPRDVSCAVTVYPPTDGDYGLVVAIEYLGMRLQKFSNQECMDYIRILIWTPVGYELAYEGCRGTEKQFYTNLVPNKGGIRIEMKTAKNIDPIKKGFDLTLTVFSKEKMLCDKSHLFKCNIGHCITKEVVCDRRSNCADASDELLHGAADCKTLRNRTGWILGVFFGTMFLGGIMVMFWSRRNRIRNRIIVSTISNGIMPQNPQILNRDNKITYKTMA